MDRRGEEKKEGSYEVVVGRGWTDFLERVSGEGVGELKIEMRKIPVTLVLE